MVSPQNMDRRRLTIITPAYNEAGNLPALYRRLDSVLANEDLDWEWVVVDDHSSDNTPDVLSRLSKSDRRIKAFRFSRNYGSHTAITCGLHRATGDCAVVIAADLQDPP